MHTCVNPLIKEAGFIRARGGSKTKDLGVICMMYLAFCGLHSVTYVAQSDMLKTPKGYYWSLVTKTFLKYALEEDPLRESCTFRSGGLYELLNLTEGKARSRRIDAAYFDEESDADETAYDASEGTFSVSEFGLIRHGSTPKKGTLFEKNIRRLKQNKGIVSILPWQQLPHIKLAHIERMRKKHPPWYFRQEYECSFEAPMGAVFRNVIEEDFGELLGKQRSDKHRQHTHYGLDWNPSAGHWIGGARLSDDATQIFVMMEKNLGTDLGAVLDYLFQLHEKDPLSVIEVEDGGTNTGFCEALELMARERGIDISWIYRREWDTQGKNKMLSITITYDSTIRVNPEITPEIAWWLARAHWDAISDTPKLEKDPDQHPLDCALHSFFRVFEEYKQTEMEWI